MKCCHPFSFPSLLIAPSRFCVRRLYGKYWNMNSLLDQPEYVSDFYLSSLLGQFKLDGYDVFVVRRWLSGKKE